MLKEKEILLGFKTAVNNNQIHVYYLLDYCVHNGTDIISIIYIYNQTYSESRMKVLGSADAPSPLYTDALS